jgi:uncharacterized protein
MRTISLEEHFATPAFMKGPGREIEMKAKAIGGAAAKLLEELSDIGPNRIANMDAAGIDIQVLSLTSPGVEQLHADEARSLARDANDHLFSAVSNYPSRFAGFAALPTPDPKAAEKELARCVSEYGFKGAMINGHAQGLYLDDRRFWPILECAHALNVPIYMHPTAPPQAVINASYAGFSEIVTYAFARAGWGWHIETAIHVLRMMLGGVFDRFPRLQLIVGHMGETLPVMLRRLDAMSTAMTKLERPISSYLRENVHYTFSSFNFTSAFLALMLEVGIERIMFSADYPYASMAAARSFLEQLPISPSDRDRIAHSNAEVLLKL